MITYLYCFADAEPPQYHPLVNEQPQQIYAVNLSVECRSPDTTDEPSAKAAFGEFLQQAQQDVRFALYRVEAELVKVEDLKLYAAGKNTPPSAALTQWLSPLPLPPENTRYWTRPIDGAPAQANTSSAWQALRAVQAWNAPVGRRFGLTYLLRRETVGTEHELYVIVPIIGEASEAITFSWIKDDVIVPGPSDQVEFLHTFGAPLTCRAAILKAPHPPTLAGRLTPEGYFKVNPDAAALHRLLSGLEQRAAGLLTVPSAFLPRGKVADAAHDEEIRYDNLFLPKDGKLPAIVSWVVVASLLTALDNIVIALLKPVAGSRTEGELLAPLIDALTAHIARALQPLDNRRWILEAIRAALGSSPLIGPSGKKDPEHLLKTVPALRYVYGLTGQPTPEQLLERRLLLAVLDSAPKPGQQAFIEVTLEPALVTAMNGTAPMTLLAKALATLQGILSEEAAAESAIVRLFDTASLFGPVANAHDSFASLLAFHLHPTPSDPLKAETASGWSAYQATLSGVFNGAEALRRAASLEFVHALLLAGPPEGSSELSASHLALRLKEANYFERRVFAVTTADDGAALFDGIITQLASPGLAPWPEGEDLSSVIRGHLNRAYTAAVQAVGDLSGEGERFIPDLAPAPLLLQIASDVTGELFDHFLDDFNGIAVAISREGPGGNTAYGHANLAELSWRETAEDEPIVRVPIALHPFLPGVSDGRGPAFLEYHGVPFSDTSFAGLRLDASGQAAPTASGSVPFYTAGPVSNPGSQPPLPRLAYGCRFHSFAFATTNAGVLPLKQQLSNAEPWLPGNPARPETDETVAQANYQRRTAITQIELIEMPPRSTADSGPRALTQQEQRLNRSLPDVIALASDYPRYSLVAPANGAATLDLYRESDGTGSLTLVFDDSHNRLALALEDLLFSGTIAKLSVQLLRLPSDTDKLFVLDEQAWQGRSIRLLVDRSPAGLVSIAVAYGSSTDSYPLGEFDPENDTRPFWLRLTLHAGNSPAAMAFAAPQGPKGSRPAPSLLMLAPITTGAWRTERVTAQADIRIKTPRVGFIDFQRWMTNPVLAKRAFNDADIAQTFVEHLEALYQIRSANKQLASFFDHLPDPAVVSLRVTLCQTDHLSPDTGFAPEVEEILLPTNTKRWKATVGTFNEQQAVHAGKAIHDLMNLIDQAFAFTLLVKPGPGKLDMNAAEQSITAYVPAGSVASLTIEALVPREFFKGTNTTPAPMYHRLQEFASGSDATVVAFPMASLLVEVMADLMPAQPRLIDLANALIDIKPSAMARRYDLAATGNPAPEKYRDQWRLFSHVTVHSQRWQFSGRPLYRRLAPKTVMWGQAPTGRDAPQTAALRLKDDQVVYDFEGELFFDRGDINADPHTCRIAPLPADTLLQTITWDSPSATYWRHRFTLRSRYAGALLPTDRGEAGAYLPSTIKDQPGRSPSETWTLRVAMLADLRRVQITRPQLRALIPLTTAIAEETPAVLAVLQEPPLDHGGLAERVSAEFKTSFGYGFSAADEPVAIQDARKEVGPDPTLSYMAMPEEQARTLVLSTEGPIGLSFDSAHAIGPAFANTLYSLTPLSLAPTRLPALEEYFLGVCLQRHLDPDWLFAPPASSNVQGGWDATRCWWMEFDLKQIADAQAMAKDDDGVKAVALLAYGPDSQAVLALEQTGDRFVLRAHTRLLEGQPDAAKPVEISGPLEQAVHLALLHNPIAPGQYGMSLFIAQARLDIGEGVSAAWLKLASVQWSPPAEAHTTGTAYLTIPAEATVSPCAASASTSIAWTRTHRDFANLTLRAENGDIDRIRVADLIARYSDGTLSFHKPGTNNPLHLISSTLSKREPLYRHRHLAFILTRLRDEPGRPMEEMAAWGLFIGRDATTAAPMAGRMSVRIAEIETPAVILCAKDITGLPPEFRRRLLDLESTGGRTAGEIRLFLRLLGSDEYITGFKKLTVHIEPIRNDKKGGVPIEINLELGLDGMRSILIAFVDKKAQIQLIEPNGNVVSAPGVDIHEALSDCVGLWLSLEAPLAAGECWCDVSLLHSKEPLGHGAFDFRWLFSQDESADMVEALQTSALASRTEAQARLISISPPVAVG